MARFGEQDVPVPVHSFEMSMSRSRTANGGFEWYFVLGSTRVYANDARVGVFTDPDVGAEEAFRRLAAQWARVISEEQR